MSKIPKLLTFATAMFAPWLLTGTVTNADTDNFAPTAAVTISNLEGVTAKPLNSFDISFVDPAIGLYVLGDRTNNAVDLVDTHSNTFLGFCGQGSFKGFTGNNNTSGPDGVLIRDSREIWVGDGDSTVKVFDVAGCSETTKPTHIIATGAPTDNRADEMCYDPVDQLIMVANNAATPPFASLISTVTYSVVKKIPFPQSTNGAEQCAWSPRTGLFYITVPGIETPDNGHGQVVVIDPATLTVQTTFDIPVAKCAVPQGMAVGPNRDILVGCNGNTSKTQSSVIIDERNGKILATVANESGPDEVWYNPGNNHYFLARSNAGSGLQSLGIIDAGTRVADTGINNFGPVNMPPTNPHPSAHSVAADSVTGKTFFPIPGGLATLCSSVGGNDASGCILVVTGQNDGDDASCVAQGAPVIKVGKNGEAKHMKGSC
jgi:hypothetical protein